MTHQYILPLDEQAAELLAKIFVQHRPDEQQAEFPFDGRRVGADDDEMVTVIVQRRRRRPTHPLFDAIAAKLDFAPEPVKV